ncbi:UDP-N-acetylglucosamine 2-epimerase (non-hydrolyzing) [Robertmurraya massiliosenegalensis]|uniref:non-hydrolyzing UDP-N-acetylglucosamine 2-epimerase n=1 Tax=Robertmurraya TaxID=2837507 RepID=UPI0039A525E2
MKILTIVGARPQFIKASMMSKEFVKEEKVHEIIVHTGQHYDPSMSETFFEQLKIPQPDYDLAVGSHSHGKQTGKMLMELEEIIIKEQPDMVLVYGDTNSTLAGALAAAKLHIPVAHVEAGLRSFNKRMPEEQNRILTDHLSTLLFCPTDTAIEHLQEEGIDKGVFQTGDIMCDTVNFFLPLALKHSSVRTKLGLEKGNYFVSTIHRAENTADSLQLTRLLNALNSTSEKIIIPIHPRTRKMMKEYQIFETQFTNLHFIEPLNYFDMLALVHDAKGVLTDSGGLQKEAYLLKTPCITLREETEWIETVAAGWNCLVGRDSSKIMEAVKNLRVPQEHPLLFGDGQTSKRMCKIILQFH